MCFTTVNKFSCGHTMETSSAVHQCESNYNGKPCTPDEQAPSYRSFYRVCKECAPVWIPESTKVESPAVNVNGKRERQFESFDPSSYSMKRVAIVNGHFVSKRTKEEVDVTLFDISTQLADMQIKDWEVTEGDGQATVSGKEADLEKKPQFVRKESDKWFDERTPYNIGKNPEEVAGEEGGKEEEDDEDSTPAYFVGTDMPNDY